MKKTLEDVSDEVAARMCKLLSLAGSSEQAEAEQAMARAKRLAVEHDIDLASIDMDSVGSVGLAKEPIVNETFKTAGGICRRPPSHRYIVRILGTHFKVRVVQQDLSSTIWFIGRRSDVVFAKYAYDYLRRTFNKLWVRYKQRHDAPMSSRDSFFMGLWLGLNDKLVVEAEDAKKDTIMKLDSETRQREVSDRYQMVLVKEEEVLKQAMDDYHPVLKAVKERRNWENHDPTARQTGYEDGKNITVATPLAERGSRREEDDKKRKELK